MGHDRSTTLDAFTGLDALVTVGGLALAALLLGLLSLLYCHSKISNV